MNGFSANVQDVLAKFDFDNIIKRMVESNTLYLIIKEFNSDKGYLGADKISAVDCGYIFEDLVRRFSESFDEEAGAHFTSRDIIYLMTDLLLCNADLSKGGNVTVYDMTMGTSQMLSCMEERIHELNSEIEVNCFGQEFNPSTYAIAKADMMIRGGDPNNMRYGDTLSEDQFSGYQFEYIISNPPFGIDWKREEKKVKEEATKGELGRFAPGLPKISDGQMLFDLNGISKLKENGRMAIIHNGSSLFTGAAESGESEIRRYIIENDWLDAIVQLSTDVFYNTGTDRYIGEISPFIQDMRVLTNICNEFLVYKRTLKMTKLKDHEMFSMIAFKNLYPKEFAELEAEKGIVKQIFKGKREFVVGKKTGIEEKIAPKKEILENVHNDILWGMRDIKHAFLGFLSDENGTRYPVSGLEINNRSYTYEQIIQDSFDISNFDNINQLRIGYRTSNNYNTQWSSFNNIKQKMDNGGKKYLSRMLDIRYAENSKKQQLIAEINGLERQVVEIEGYSLREIIDNFGESFLPEQLEKYEFLKFLLIKGYINESYADYINYFHPNSITKDENDYLRSIRMRNGVKNYGFEIKNLQQVSDRIYDTEYRHPETLNYLLTDFMLTTCTNQENKRYYFDGFEMDKSNTHYQFAKEYIERGQNVGLFVSELCKYYIHIWKCVLEDVTLSDEVKYKYLELIFNNATMPQIENINEADNSNCIKNFIVEDENSLAMLNGVSSDVMIEFISEQSVVFCKVNNTGADKQVLEFIYKNNMYELNRDMIASVIGFYHPELEEELSKSHYTTLIKVNNDVLNTRIWGSFEEYVNLFVLGIAENTAEDIETVEDIIERLANINVDLVFEVLDKEQVSWADFNECCTNDVEKDIKKKIWNYLLQNQRIYATWNNFDAYYTEFGLTSELSTWVNKICKDIVHTEITGNINDDCIKKIITNSEILLQTVEQIRY